MPNKKEYEHKYSGIEISQELSEEEKNYILAMYDWKESSQLPMLTEKIILLSKKIEKFDRSTTFLNKTLIGITILLVAMAFIQILLPVIFSEFSWKWKFILVGITIIVLVFLFHYIKKHYLYNPDKI